MASWVIRLTDAGFTVLLLNELSKKPFHLRLGSLLDYFSVRIWLASNLGLELSELGWIHSLRNECNITPLTDLTKIWPVTTSYNRLPLASCS